MKIPSPNKKASSGITLVEALLVVTLIALLVLLILPIMARDRTCHGRPYCLNNLKQIDLAFRVWAGDHDDKFPMEVSVTNGGSKEFVNTPQAFQHFKAISNELGQSPIVVVCPDDSLRKYAKKFDAGFGNSNLSYFINVSATTNSDPAITVLCGDRNITPNGNRLFLTQSNQVIQWDANIHNNQGCLLFGDGHVENMKSFQSSGETLSIP